MLTKQETLLGKGAQETHSAAWLTVSGFMVMGLVSGWSLANHSNSVFPGGARIAQPRWMLARGILGSRLTRGVSFQPFPNSSGWWWLISSLFLIRISCHKTTHANGYYGAWPGWAVSNSMLPLTISSRTPFRPLGNASAFCPCNTRQVCSSAGKDCMLYHGQQWSCHRLGEQSV